MPAVNLYTGQTQAPLPPPTEEAYSPPPQQQQMLEPTPLGGSAPPQQQAMTEATPLGQAPAPQAPQAAPPREEAANLPPATPRAEREPSAVSQIPVIGGPLQAVGDVFRGGDPAPFRPAPEGVQGQGPEYYAQEIDKSKEQLGQALQSGNPIDVAKSAAGVAGSYIQMNKGEISPEAAGNKRAMADYIYAVQTTGQPPAWSLQPQVGGVGPSFHDNYHLDPFVQTALGSDQDNFKRAYEEGYTTPDGVVWAPGADAMWEYYAGGLTVPQRAVADTVAAPIGVLTDVASGTMAKGGKKLTEEGIDLAARELGTGTAQRVAGQALETGARLIDIPATAGLSEVVPGAFKAGGALINKTPLGKQTVQAGIEQGAAETAELGGALLSERRAAGLLPGNEPTYLSGSKGVQRITLPAEGAAPPVDFAYKADKYGLVVYDDPGTNLIPRRPTAADLGTVQDALGRLPQRDRAAVRGPWWDWGMRNQDSAGDDLIEPFSPTIRDAAGNVVADSKRNRTAYDRHLADLTRELIRDDTPGVNRPVMYELMRDWQRTLYGGQLHPLTKRPMAEHRLQTIKDVLAKAPEHNDAWAQAQIGRMEAMLPKPPGTVGTGRKWLGKTGGKTTGSLVPYTKPETERMQHFATVNSRAFWKGGKKTAYQGFEAADARSNLVDLRKPMLPPGSTPTVRQQTAYDNAQGVLAARLQNPVLRRGDVGAMRDRFRSAATKPVSKSTQAELEGLKDALERGGILPGASTMSTADIETALTGWLKATPRFAVDLPPEGAAIRSMRQSAMGVYTPGGVEELFGMSLPPNVIDHLETTYDIGGATYRVADRLIEWDGRIQDARQLAQDALNGRALTAGEDRAVTTTINLLAKLHPEYQGLTRAEFAALPDRQIDRLAAASVGAERETAGWMKATGKPNPPPKNALVRLYDNYLGMYRSLTLYNPARGVAYPLMQSLGNLFTLGIAAREALPYYSPLEYRAVMRAMKDPEVAEAFLPRALRMRDDLGLGRSANMGRVSRDQMGGYTWFNDPQAGSFRKAIGKVAAPQAIKDWADSWDTLHRQSLWSSVMEPAYKRLKQDLPDMAEIQLEKARARTGLLLPATKQDLSDAITTLERNADGYFSAAELREALFQAMGGKSAANTQEVWNVADRIHRLYREELGRLDGLAQKEVDRVAFAGGDTNLDSFMQRAFLFSWWSTRAAKLYLTEIAKSPIQMALWSRAVAAGQRREQAGTSPAYRDFIEFMRTPAGFTMALDPTSLSGTVGTFASMDEPSLMADLTGLGRFLEGGWLGNNFFLAPPIKAALGTIGALGADYRQPDLTGVARSEREVNDLLELVNSHIHTFYATRDGAPRAVPNIDLNAFQNILASQVSGILPGTQVVAPRDPNSQQEANLTRYVTDEVLRLNPELGEPDAEGHVYGLEQAVREAMENPDSEIYQSALDSYVQQLYAGPMTDKGGALAVLGAVIRDNSPFQMSTMPTIQDERLRHVNRDSIREDTTDPATGLPAFLTPDPERTAVDKMLGWLPYETEAGRAYNLAEQNFYSGGDPAVKAALGTVGEIRDATITEPVTVAGMTFTPEQLQQMSQKDRNSVAYFWLDASGNGGAQAAADDARDEALATHPELADAFGWRDWIAQYPGGTLRAVEDTALVNPNVRNWLSSPDAQRVMNESPEAFEEAVGYLGPLVAGIQESRYGMRVDPQYRGVVGGLQGTVGQWYLENQAEHGSYGAEKAEAVTGDLADYQATVDKLNAYDPSGATAEEYRANILNGSGKPIPYAAYKAGISGFTGSDGDWFPNYLAWASSEPQGMDTSPEQWVEEDRAAYNRKRTIEIANAFADGTYVATDPVVDEATGEPVVGLPDAGRPAFYAEVTMLRGGNAYTQPNGKSVGPIPPDVPMTVLQVGDDSRGTKWALVQLADGTQLYVPTADLQKAA